MEALWREYEAQQTPASHLVKDFDKLEMILQAAEYEGAQVRPWVLGVVLHSCSNSESYGLDTAPCPRMGVPCRHGELCVRCTWT